MDGGTPGGEMPATKRRSTRPSSAQSGTRATGSPKPKPRSRKATSPTRASPKTTAPEPSATTTTGATKRRARSGDAAPSREGPARGRGSPPSDRSGARRGRPRPHDLYDRGEQRANEQWPVVARILSRTLRHPGTALRLFGETGPVERDGRVLNRGLQAFITGAARIGLVKDVASPADMPTPFAMRRWLRSSAQALMPVRTDVYVSGRVVPGPDDAPPIGLRLYRRFGSGLSAGIGTHRRLPAIVYYHGGGWVSGDLDSHDALCRILAVASGCLVVAVDYRLAPEHPFPAAVDDALAAYAWVHRHGDELGIDPVRIGVMGDSAGANLAAVVAQLTRAGTGRSSVPGAAPPPVAQGLVYPVVDVRFGFESMRSLGQGFLLTRTAMEYYRDHYVPDASEWENPLASPLLAGDLRGLAPALVVTAGFDPLRDDGLRYAEALRRAGVAVAERRYEDQIHGFMIMGIVSDSLAVTTEVCESMGRLMRRGSMLAAVAPGDADVDPVARDG